MTDRKFIATFILLLFIQLVLTKYCQFEPFLYICLLPSMVLCISTAKPGWRVMIAAFAAGLIVDGLADGPLGLNAMAAVAVAATRRPILIICIGEDVVERGYGFSFRSNGFFKILLALLLSTSIFFAVYVTADSIGLRSALFNLGKWTCSTAVSVLMGLFAINVLSPYKKN